MHGKPLHMGRTACFTLCAGVAAAISGMSASEWEIRNSASLVFTSLVVRTVGFKNVLKVVCSSSRHSSIQITILCMIDPARTDFSSSGGGIQGEAPKRAITGAEFFHRFPLLHSYLLDQLKAAASAMRAPATQLHPSLYPILVLLARLRSSPHSRNAAQVRCQASRPNTAELPP